MKKIKSIIALIVVVLMLASFIPAFAQNETKDAPAVGEIGEGYVVIDCEGLTLGQGCYCEPMLLSYEEIVEIYNASHSDQVTVDTLTAGHATLVMYELMGWEYQCTGSVGEGTLYISAIKDIDTGVIDIPQVIADNGNVSNEDNTGNDDEWLGEFDYSYYSGWMITVDNFMINVGCAGWYLDGDYSDYPISDYGGTHVIRWQFTIDGYGSDLGIDTGWGAPALFEGADKGELIKLYAEINSLTDWFDSNGEARQAALDVIQHLDATQEEVDAAYQELYDAYFSPEVIDWQTALNTTLGYIHSTVAAPSVGTYAGEWSVLALARGNYFESLENEYFDTYRQNVINYIAENGTEAHGGTILHERKSTENSRVIIGLASIGIDARDIGGYDLVTPLFDYDYTVWQGINGPVFALIALDTFMYEAPEGVRESYIQNILDSQSSGGGWAFGGGSADPDMTGMTIQALAPYYESNDEVRAAVDTALDVLSNLQRDDGGFASWGTVNSESSAQVIVALTAMGLDPMTDSRFIKNGNTLIDAILDFYVDGGGFCHTADGSVNAMATDQAAYALVAYSRYINNMTSLYDMSDSMPEIIISNGDIDMNGTIEASDALLLMRHIMQLSALSEEQLAFADMNDNGSLDFDDAILILRAALAA